MTTVSEAFLERWRSDNQVGPYRPQMKVEVRVGRYFRDFGPFTPPEGGNWPLNDCYALIPTSPSNNSGKPWQATWTPQGDWMTLRGIAEVSEQKAISANNGIGSCSVTVENTRLLQFMGQYGQYHLWDRGYLTPFRDTAVLPNWANAPAYQQYDKSIINAWINILVRDAQIRIWQGYGADEWVPTFIGLIDDVEFDSGENGDQAVLTCRNHGRILSDSRLFGWNKDPTTKDPIYFCDRGWAQSNPSKVGSQWIQVDDIANIVRLMLTWAGFKHWQVNDVGWGLNPGQPLMFDRSHFYIDAIQQICQMTGYVFFVGDPDPTDDHSIGIPVFRYPRNLVQLSTSETLLVHDKHLLTGVQAIVSDTDRAYIIRVRGKIPDVYTAEGYPIAVTQPTQLDQEEIASGHFVTNEGDQTIRPMAVYRPPWTQHNQEAGILKHVTHTDDYLVTYQDCLVTCYLIAAQEAEAAYRATAVCPGNPAIGLDTHVSIFDHGTGITTRLWISDVKHDWKWGVDQEGEGVLIWATTFTGSMLDAPDMQGIIADINAQHAAGNQVLPPGYAGINYRHA